MIDRVRCRLNLMLRQTLMTWASASILALSIYGLSVVAGDDTMWESCRNHKFDDMIPEAAGSTHEFDHAGWRAEPTAHLHLSAGPCNIRRMPVTEWNSSYCGEPVIITGSARSTAFHAMTSRHSLLGTLLRLWSCGSDFWDAVALDINVVTRL